ncbi:MAG: CRTAC1 family protein [Caldilineaceae bacterium]|nr:CRTAC1 family protein [Caldilineaceae bacterium]
MKRCLRLVTGGIALLVLAACVIPPAPEPEFGIVHGPPSRAFVDATRSAGIEAVHRGEFAMDGVEGYLGVGQAWGDYDNDGWVDLFVTGNLAPNVLYHNQQDGRFAVSPWSDQLAFPEQASGGAVWADYDNDGWLDLYILNKEANTLMRNLAGQGFVDVTAEAGVGDTAKGQSAAWGDFDNDGWLDLYVVNWTCLPDCKPVDFETHQDRLYRNNGDGTFTDLSNTMARERLLGAGFAGSFLDYDNDGDLDVYVVNDEYANPIGNVLWRNDGPGCGGWCWQDAGPETGAGIVTSGMGLAVNDYDNDGDLDMYFSNMVRPMTLLTNDGTGGFVNTEATAGVGVHENGVTGWGALFFDYDNDGWRDLFLAATTVKPRALEPGALMDMLFERQNYLYHNQQDGSFQDVTPETWQEQPRPTMGAAYADYDRDGWLDFVVTEWNEGFTLYRNQGAEGAGHHWLTVRLIGGQGVNRDAIGARVTVETEGGPAQMQEVKSGSSLGAGNELSLHFGLGSAPQATVTIVWPDGFVETHPAVAADQVWQVAR